MSQFCLMRTADAFGMKPGGRPCLDRISNQPFRLSTTLTCVPGSILATSWECSLGALKTRVGSTISYLSQIVGEALAGEATAVVAARSDVPAILDSAGEVLTALSDERGSFGSPPSGFDCDFVIGVASEPLDGLGVSEGVCSLSKKLPATIPPTNNTPIAAGKIPKRPFFFVTSGCGSALATGPPLMAAGKLVGW